MTRTSTSAGRWPHPARLVCLVALVATHGLVRLAERYLPEYLSALGYGPIAVGTVLAFGLFVAAAASRASAPPLETDGVPVAGLATLLTALGLLVWAGAPALDTALGTPISALGWLAVGVSLLQAWHYRGPVRDLWPVDTGTVGVVSSADDRRRSVVVGALGVGAAAVFATAAIASADAVPAGFALVAATGAAVALVATVGIGTVDANSIPFRTPARIRSVGLEAISANTDVSSLAAIYRTVADLPDRQRWTLVGDALVRFALAASSPFLILLVVEYRPIGLSFRGLSLAPVAVFGLFVLAESLGAVVGAAGSLLDATVDRQAVLTVGLAVLALLPMALLAAPRSAGIVALLFAVLGCRTAIEPLRPTVAAVPAVAPGGPGDSTRWLPPVVREAVRFALVPAPLVGGLLYAISPVVAFTLSTAVGLLGVRELLRALAHKHYLADG